MPIPVNKQMIAGNINFTIKNGTFAQEDNAKLGHEWMVVGGVEMFCNVMNGTDD